MLENTRKTVVTLVLMNRHINHSSCERYIMSGEIYVVIVFTLNSSFYPTTSAVSPVLPDSSS